MGFEGLRVWGFRSALAFTALALAFTNVALAPANNSREYINPLMDLKTIRGSALAIRPSGAAVSVDDDLGFLQQSLTRVFVERG